MNNTPDFESDNPIKNGKYYHGYQYYPQQFDNSGNKYYHYFKWCRILYIFVQGTKFQVNYFYSISFEIFWSNMEFALYHVFISNWL